MIQIKRKKVGDRSYHLIDVGSGMAIATASQTGERGRDNYPWEWHLFGSRIFGRLNASTGRSEESLKAAIDYIQSEGTSNGILKPVGTVSGYDIKEGQTFRYGAYYYRATKDAHGEFNAYIPAVDHRGGHTEIVVRHENTVTLYEVELH
jgi:hypothetical protein